MKTKQLVILKIWIILMIFLLTFIAVSALEPFTQQYYVKGSDYFQIINQNGNLVVQRWSQNSWVNTIYTPEAIRTISSGYTPTQIPPTQRVTITASASVADTPTNPGAVGTGTSSAQTPNTFTLPRNARISPVEMIQDPKFQDDQTKKIPSPNKVAMDPMGNMFTYDGTKWERCLSGCNPEETFKRVMGLPSTIHVEVVETDHSEFPSIRYGAKIGNNYLTIDGDVYKVDESSTSGFIKVGTGGTNTVTGLDICNAGILCRTDNLQYTDLDGKRRVTASDSSGRVIQEDSRDWQKELGSMIDAGLQGGYAMSSLLRWLGVDSKPMIDLNQAGIAKYLSVDSFISNEICKIPIDENQVSTSVFLADSAEIGAHIEGYKFNFNGPVDCVNKTNCVDAFNRDNSMKCEEGYCVNSSNQRPLLSKIVYKISLKFSPSKNVVNKDKFARFYVRVYYDGGSELWDLNGDGKKNQSDIVSLPAGSDYFDFVDAVFSEKAYTKVCMDFEGGDLSNIFTPKFYTVWQEIATGNSLCNSFVREESNLGNTGESFMGLMSGFASAFTLGKASFSQTSIGNTTVSRSSAVTSGGGTSSAPTENRPGQRH